MNNQTEIEALQALLAECDRFKFKAKAAILRLKEDGNYPYGGTKEMGAAKRAALDLKCELSHFTTGRLSSLAKNK